MLPAQNMQKKIFLGVKRQKSGKLLDGYENIVSLVRKKIGHPKP